MKRFDRLAIADPSQLVFGLAPHPLKTRSGITLGAGIVYPEINFTLPPMAVEAATMPEVVRIYREMIRDVLVRAAELEAPGVVVEFETLPPMTENPDFGMAVVDVLLEGMANARDKYGLKSILRSTPNDTREMERPPRMRDGQLVDCMFELFDRSAAAGAELLSIESVGGKEVHDDALTYGEIKQVVFALCILGVRDMHWLWERIVGIANRHGVIAAGDTACGFANTAMVLAEQKMISRTFAAVVRAISTVRSLVAYEEGALGPGKDCGYENVYLKAITGFPMAMEGKSAACAHFSPVGNIAACACDTWSNESVQHVKLLSGMAPKASMEQLTYDCRLLNRALAEGPETAGTLRRLLSDSDRLLDPHATVLTPEAAVAVGRAVVEAPSPFEAGRMAGLAAVAQIRAGAREGLRIDPMEAVWLDRTEQELTDMTTDEEAFIAEMMEEVDVDKFRPQDYGIPLPAGV